MTRFEFDGRSLVREVFIETGTGEGDTLDHARRAGFAICHSIEVHRGNAAQARLRFAADFRVHVHLGNSPRVLPLIMADRPTTFWLDAHFRGCSREEMDPDAGECPLLAELRAIRCVRWTKRPVILIDDARMFDRPWPKELARGWEVADWPTGEEIAAALPGYTIRRAENVLYAME